MPPTLGDRLEHIIQAIDSIGKLLGTNSEDDISANRMLRSAMEREFEIICEASRHVPADVKAREAHINWAAMTSLGNLLRHAYHLTDVSILFQIARYDLPALKKFVERILAEESKP